MTKQHKAYLYIPTVAQKLDFFTFSTTKIYKL